MKRNLIFVDIDGVLNNISDGTSYYCLNSNTYGISNENFKNLLKLVKDTNSKVVISSSWSRHPYDFVYDYNGIKIKSPLSILEKMLAENLRDENFKFEKIPHLKGCNKRDDILGYFYILKFERGFTKEDFNFVVLDDVRNQGLEYFSKRFFCIDPISGLTKSDIMSISLFLNDERNLN